MIVWVDLETTGLDPNTDEVLEVAAIVTDDALNEVARFGRVIYAPVADVCARHAAWIDADETRRRDAEQDSMMWRPIGTRVDPVVVKMHAKNGLWGASRDGQALATVDQDLSAFIVSHASGAQLAGSTISFDRAFMQHDLPLAHSRLHYRNIDVTSFNEISRRFWPKVWEGRPRGSGSTHRAMADIQESIAVAKYYVREFGSGEVLA